MNILRVLGCLGLLCGRRDGRGMHRACKGLKCCCRDGETCLCSVKVDLLLQNKCPTWKPQDPDYSQLWLIELWQEGKYLDTPGKRLIGQVLGCRSILDSSLLTLVVGCPDWLSSPSLPLLLLEAEQEADWSCQGNGAGMVHEAGELLNNRDGDGKDQSQSCVTAWHSKGFWVLVCPLCLLCVLDSDQAFIILCWYYLCSSLSCLIMFLPT